MHVHRHQVTQFVAEEPLVVMNLRGKAEGPKRTTPITQEKLDATRDEKLNQMVVERPSRLVVARDGRIDEADTFIDHRRDDRQRRPSLVPRDPERNLGSSE
jgi:hypothetical protein